jgi:hypothetical protein
VHSACGLADDVCHVWLQLTPAGLVETAVFDTADGLYDCAWSEENENVVLAASGDGSVKVYDLAAPPMANPLRVFREHKHEVGQQHTSCTASTALNPVCLPSSRPLYGHLKKQLKQICSALWLLLVGFALLHAWDTIPSRDEDRAACSAFVCEKQQLLHNVCQLWLTSCCAVSCSAVA